MALHQKQVKKAARNNLEDVKAAVHNVRERRCRLRMLSVRSYLRCKASVEKNKTKNREKK